MSAALLDDHAVTAAIAFGVVPGPDPAWPAGPLAAPMPPWSVADGWATSTQTDRAARGTYFAGPVVSALNGTKAAPARWFSSVDTTLDGARVWALEAIRIDGTAQPGGLLVVHVTAGSVEDKPVGVLERVVRLPTAEASRVAELEALLPAGWSLDPSARRGVSVAFAPDRAAGVEPEALALWELASATSLASFRPSADDLAGGTRLDLSADWSAYVLRDGIGFLARPSAGRFVGLARVLVHSVYLDVLLLTRAQMAVVASVADTLADRGLVERNLNGLVRLERSMFDFRRRIWWTTVGPHAHSDALLNAYHSAHRLPDRVARLIADVADAARLAQSIGAARTNAALAILSVIGVPFGISYAGAVLFATPGWVTFTLATVVAAGLAVLVASTRPMRETLRNLWRGGGPT